MSTCHIGGSIIVISTIHFNYKLLAVPLFNSTALLRTYPTSYTFEWSEEKVQPALGTPLKCVTDTIETQTQVRFKRKRRTSREWVKGVSSKSRKSISVSDLFVGNRKTKLFRRRTGFFYRWSRCSRKSPDWTDAIKVSAATVKRIQPKVFVSETNKLHNDIGSQFWDSIHSNSYLLIKLLEL